MPSSRPTPAPPPAPPPWQIHCADDATDGTEDPPPEAPHRCVVLKESLAVRWLEFHLPLFGALFIAIVLLVPGGLVEAGARIRRALRAAVGVANEPRGRD
jgi:hypothetical protein